MYRGGYLMRALSRLAAASAVMMACSAPVYAGCALNDISPTAIACAVASVDDSPVTGNVLDNKAIDVTAQINGLAAIGFTWDGTNFADFDKLTPAADGTIDFSELLSGITFVGIHTGGKGGGVTYFYKFDAGASLDAFTLNLPRGSGAVLYFTGAQVPSVPETATWAMMLGGFAMVGGAMRYRRAKLSLRTA